MPSYFSHLKRAIDFIEQHITEEITLESVAKEAGFSLYHFHRIFHSIVGMSLKEYIRKRRLSLAAHQLNTTKRNILEVAIDYQFSSAETFTRAFKKNFNINPGEFRKSGVQLPLCEKVNIDNKVNNLLKGFDNLTPEIVTKPSFTIIGERMRMNLTDERNIQQEIEFAYDFGIRNCWSLIPERKNPKTAVALGCEYDPIGNMYTQILGGEVNSVGALPDGMIHYTVPPTKYAVFKVYGLRPLIQMAWDNIFGDWIMNSQFEHDTNGPHIEFYREDWIGIEPEYVQIYIPLK